MRDAEEQNILWDALSRSLVIFKLIFNIVQFSSAIRNPRLQTSRGGS
jgi:hypothetical protein